MVEFKAKADEIIKERWGIEVEHVSAGRTYEELFYSIVAPNKKNPRSKRAGLIYGFPYMRGNWCNSRLKKSVLDKIKGVQLLGIAADEPNRFHNLTETKRSPLVEAGWTEAVCREWCEKNGLLSPIYTTATRGGLLVLPQSGCGSAPAFEKELPGILGIDAQMGFGFSGIV